MMTVEVCKKCYLKVNFDKRGQEEGLVWEVCTDVVVSKFKYLGFKADKSGAEGSEYCMKREGGRRAAGVIRSFVNPWNFLPEA